MPVRRQGQFEIEFGPLVFWSDIFVEDVFEPFLFSAL